MSALQPRLHRLTDFVGALGRLIDQTGDEAADPGRGRRLLAGLIARDDWLPDAYASPTRSRYQQYLLHCDSRERFSVVSFVWGPGQATPIHDHTVWGLVGVLRGAELSQRFARNGEPSPPPAPSIDWSAARSRRSRPRSATSTGDQRLRRPRLDQHPRLRRQYRRRAALDLRRRRPAQAVRLRLRQHHPAQPLGPLEAPPGEITP
jgi:hypothetical protein